MIIKKKQVSQITLPWQLTGCCRTSILSRTLFAMVSTSKSLLTARWVMRSVGEKFTFCLQKIGGSSSSFMCMNPVVLCKTHIFEKKTHKIYIETLKATSTIRRGICERNYVKFAHNFNWKKTSNITRDRQRTRNVTLRHVRVTTVAAEKQWVLHNLSVSICRLGYPECNTHPPCCHLWPAPLHNMFSTLSHKRYDFWRKVTEHKTRVSIFSTISSQDVFFILRGNEPDMNKNVYRSSSKVLTTINCHFLSAVLYQCIQCSQCRGAISSDA